MDISGLFQVMIQLFLILMLGFTLYKVGILDVAANKKLSELIVKVTSPLLILSSVLKSQTEGRMDVLLILGAGFLLYVGYIIIGKIISHFPLFPKEDRGVYECMCVFSNNSFMGFPVLLAILGQESIFFSSMINFSFNIFIFTYAVGIFSRDAKKNGQAVDDEPMWKRILSPGLVLTVVALIVYLSGFRNDGFLYDTVYMVGSVTSPLSMIVLGSSLATYKLKESMLDYRSYVFAVVRLVVIPLIVYGVCKLIGVNDFYTCITVVTAGMPVASLVMMICNIYGGNSKTVVKNIIVSTLLSVVTIPILVSVLFG